MKIWALWACLHIHGPKRGPAFFLKKSFIANDINGLAATLALKTNSFCR